MRDFETILEKLQGLPEGTWIPKPQSAESSKFERWGLRRGERALIYSMPNHTSAGKRYEKGVNISEIRQAFDQLVDSGEFSRSWFQKHMPDCNQEGSCNYTTIGGLFELLEIAKHSGPGLYQRYTRGSNLLEI